MALENVGDIDRQTISGAVSTATHGTGARFRNLSSMIEAMELVLPDGTLLEVSPTSGADLLPAVRVGLGALGVIATVTLRTVPAFTIRRTDSPMPLDETLERLQDLADGSDHFEFYVFPHTDVALLRQSERTDEPPQPGNPLLRFGQEIVLENWAMGAIARAGRRVPSRIPRLSRFVSSQLAKSTKMDRSYRVFASRRLIRFTEMEYAIPRRHATDVIPRVLETAERADPPVVKIVDYGKHKYEQSKLKKDKKPKGQDVKGVKLSPNIGEHDVFAIAIDNPLTVPLKRRCWSPPSGSRRLSASRLESVGPGSALRCG